MQQIPKLYNYILFQEDRNLNFPTGLISQNYGYLKISQGYQIIPRNIISKKSLNALNFSKKF